MRRLIKQTFTLTGQRYMFTVDTDGFRLYLNCYHGSSEKNDKPELTKELKEKIYSAIAYSEGSQFASNAVYREEKINDDVRKYYKIPYPDIPEYEEVLNWLTINGSMKFTATDTESLFEYLKHKGINAIMFEYKGDTYIFNANPDKGYLWKFVQQIDKEIAELNELRKKLLWHV
ncbi:hypothetical protein FHS18_001166 [Paenibacillus phyllosphaerae]|uniref:Uncharacterized protein n=1 Tax=Paenibacillus phyllosphaerae TaxID=274593 RepID=A0A7W5AUP7_9BACL|nr:hypothetical protein [Paenibacillus phyllosphaerae]MBB3109114.1 hypothetical protein [Paenibacillus phyllosphaerae]